MGIKERRLREKEEVRSTILTAGWRLVKEEGWESLSIRKIADAIEYSIPVISRLRFAVFYDVGNVYQDPYSFSGTVNAKYITPTGNVANLSASRQS